MTPRTRYFLLGATAFLTVGLIGGLVAYYGIPSIGAVSNEPDELVYVPSDAAVVAYANVRQIMNSEVRQQVRQIFPPTAGSSDSDGRRQFEEHTGINIETDIEHVVAYVIPSGAANGQNDAAILARGRFNPERLEQLAQRDGGTVEIYKGKRLVVHRLNTPATGFANPDARIPNPNRNPDMALAFIQPGLIVFGTDRVVRRSIDLESGQGSSVTTNDALLKLIRDNQQGNLWVVGSFERLNGRVPLPQNLLNNLPAITYFAASGEVGNGVSGRVRAQARDSQAARDLSDVVRGFIAFGKLQANAWPEVRDALQSLQLQSEGDSVTLSFSLSASAIQALMQRRPRSNAQ